MSADEPEVVTHVKPEQKQTLLKKYDIPIEHISYEYIESCTDGKELERIVQILRSGEEGSYPHLLKFTEDRLEVVKPSSQVLRVIKPVLLKRDLDKGEIKEIENDISNWMQEMRVLERDLEDEKTLSQSQVPLPQVSVRRHADAKTKPRQPMRSKEERLRADDYHGWDKYDADTELSRIDLVAERETVEAKRMQEKHKRELAKTRKEAIIEKSLLTGTELSYMASREREKGNEAFRAGDYDEALQLYTTSISLDDDINSYNNRAMTHIKLKNYEKAIKDCNTVLRVDCTNLKAMLRRALALDCIGKKSEALKSYEEVLKIEPDNKTAMAFVSKMREIDDSKPVRLTIEEIFD